MAIIGFVDELRCDLIRGWAKEEEDLDPVEVLVLLGDRIINRTQANQFRNDLNMNGIGGGFHAFYFENINLNEEDVPNVSVKVVGKSSERLLIESQHIAPQMQMSFPFVESPFFSSDKNNLRRGYLLDLADEYHKSGFAIIDLDIDHLIENIKDEVESLFTEASDGSRSFKRVQDAWHESESVKQLACNNKGGSTDTWFCTFPKSYF